LPHEGHRSGIRLTDGHRLSAPDSEAWKRILHLLTLLPHSEPLTLASTPAWSPCLSCPVTLVSTSEGPL
jgi:hypothetical protein